MDLDQRQRVAAKYAENPKVSCSTVWGYWYRLVCARMTWCGIAWCKKGGSCSRYSRYSRHTHTSKVDHSHDHDHELQELYATSASSLVSRLGSVTMMCFVDEASVCDRDGCVEEIIPYQK